MVTRPPGAAGAVVVGSLAPRQVTGAVAVHRDAEVVAVGEPEARAALVRRAGSRGSTAGPRGSTRHRGSPSRGTRRSTRWHRCRRPPRRPGSHRAAGLPPPSGSRPRPWCRRAPRLRGAPQDLPPSAEVIAYSRIGACADGVGHVGGEDGSRGVDGQRDLGAVEVVRAVLHRAVRLLLAAGDIAGPPRGAAVAGGDNREPDVALRVLVLGALRRSTRSRPARPRPPRQTSTARSCSSSPAYPRSARSRARRRCRSHCC